MEENIKGENAEEQKNCHIEDNEEEINSEQNDFFCNETDAFGQFDEKTRERLKKALKTANERFFRIFDFDKNAKPTINDDDFVKAAVGLEMSSIKTNAEDTDQEFKPRKKNPLDPYDTLEWLEKQEKIEENLEKREEMFDEKCKQYENLTTEEKEKKIYDAFAGVRDLNNRLLDMDKRANPIKSDEKFWLQTLVNASISAMQGIQESGKAGLISDMIPEELAKISVKIGKALVKELKAEIHACGDDTSLIR